MVGWIARRIHLRAGGYALVELLTTILIIGILLSIALPMMRGIQARAWNRDAQTTLRYGVETAKTAYNDNQTYVGVNFTKLATLERGFTFVNSTVLSTSPKSVSAYAANATTWYGAALSKSGTCYAIRDIIARVNGGTAFARSNAVACRGNAVTALAYSATGW